MGLLQQLYKSLFGKNYQEVWMQFAKECNGTFILANEGNEDSVEIFYKDLKITFDTYTHIIVAGRSSREYEYTRVKVELVLADNLKFMLLRQGFIDSIGKLFGAQDIVIGVEKFDNAFMVKGNNDGKIRQLFSNNTIRNLVLSHNDIRLELLDTVGIFDETIPDGISVLYYISEKKIKNIEQLNSLYKLYLELLNQLIIISSAKPIKARY